jgi:succinate dehydrogenase / fumarate reductase cytochrome b subunit
MTISSNNSKILTFYSSTIGKKIITGVTGLGLTLFVLFHMVANLTLLTSTEAYNQLAHLFNSLGILLYTVELILLGLVIFHVAIAISIQLNKQQARQIPYKKYQSVGEPSKQSISSHTMIITGLILLVFLVFHILTFKFGQYYPTIINGVEMRDLAKLVVEKFQSPLYAFGYVAVMVFLGFHLRHGVWSAFQSLGVNNISWSPLIYSFALIFAILIAVGFVVLPLGIYGGFIG